MDTHASRLMTEALWLVLELSAPPIIVASVVGLLVSIIQSATQLQDQTMQYACKFVAIVLTLAVSANLMSGVLLRFATEAFNAFPQASIR